MKIRIYYTIIICLKFVLLLFVFLLPCDLFAGEHADADFYTELFNFAGLRIGDKITKANEYYCETLPPHIRDYVVAIDENYKYYDKTTDYKIIPKKCIFRYRNTSFITDKRHSSFYVIGEHYKDDSYDGFVLSGFVFIEEYPPIHRDFAKRRWVEFLDMFNYSNIGPQDLNRDQAYARVNSEILVMYDVWGATAAVGQWAKVVLIIKDTSLLKCKSFDEIKKYVDRRYLNLNKISDEEKKLEQKNKAEESKSLWDKFLDLF